MDIRVPNTASSGRVNLNIQAPFNAPAIIAIYDLSGKMVWNGVSETNETITLTNILNKGIYFIRAESVGEAFTTKFVVE